MQPLKSAAATAPLDEGDADDESSSGALPHAASASASAPPSAATRMILFTRVS
jgi:hypothetical protein